MVLNGATTLFMLIDGEDLPHPLEAIELIVVPQGDVASVRVVTDITRAP